jgi:hypothetical protein
MPLYRAAEGQGFSEDLGFLSTVFDDCLAKLKLVKRHGDPLVEIVAQRMITLAKAGERDPERLCEAASKGLS